MPRHLAATPPVAYLESQETVLYGISCRLSKAFEQFDDIQHATTYNEPNTDPNPTTMAYSSRSMPSGHLRQTSVSSASAGMSLQARVNEKREELENLKQLRDLSAAVASQMEALEEKLSTLSGGTEAIATVMANWHNVLRAINMASTKLPRAATETEDSSVALPQMLVRIPTEHAPTLQAQADEAAAAAAALEEEGEAS